MNLIVKLEEGSRVENLQAQRCRTRLDHLESADAENLADWNNTRLKRILVDYMLRMSYYETAVKLAESSNIMVIYGHFTMLILDCFYAYYLKMRSSFYNLQGQSCHYILMIMHRPFHVNVHEGKCLYLLYIESYFYP